jgi:hypothetical protein
MTCFHCGFTVTRTDAHEGVCYDCVQSLRTTWRRMDEYMYNNGY